MSTLSKNQLFDNKYTILFFVKKGKSTETYRVKSAEGKLCFLKLFYPAALHHTSFDTNGNLLEIEFLRRFKHPNIVSYEDRGEVIVGNKKFLYLVEHYIAGETLAERMLREPISTLYDIRQVLSGVLKGLQYLHSLSEPVIHNEITPQNIMIDLSGKTPVAKLIDFGYARSFMQSSKTYNKDGLNLQYVSNECITTGVFSPQSDLFSVGVVLYQMLFGMLPYSLNNYELQITNQRLSEANYKKLLEQREKNLRFPDVAGRIIDFDNSILNILQKALQNNSEQRFQSAIDFLQALNGDVPIENFQSAQNTVNGINLKKYSSDKSASGFAAIAGMQELKTMLQSDVIDIIQNPEEYRLHNLGLPNGMLLYGPPGCGKTFFAEKFAEETGYNFIKVKTSDIASTYVHGTQEKIGKIFDEARAKAPTILYFDELDAMTPDRENVQRSYASEVNEFLSQLDNIGDSGVFVIASTNKPQLIDKAVIRAGRLEKHFYVPPPDFEARRAMFELYLKNRPLVFGIDYEKLATLTENYVSSEIKLIVDEASRKVIREKQKRISMEILETVIKNQRPTMSLDVLRSFEKIKNQMLGIKEEHPEIGP